MKEKQKAPKTPTAGKGNGMGWTVASAEAVLRHATKGQMSRRECGAADYLRLVAKGRTWQSRTSGVAA